MKKLIEIIFIMFLSLSLNAQSNLIFKAANENEKGDYVIGKLYLYNSYNNIILSNVFVDYLESYKINNDSLIIFYNEKIYNYSIVNKKMVDSIPFIGNDFVSKGFLLNKKNVYYVAKNLKNQIYFLFRYSLLSKKVTKLCKLDFVEDISEAPFLKMKFLDSTRLFIESSCFDFFIYDTKLKTIKKNNLSVENPAIRFCFTNFTKNGILFLRFKEGYTYDIQFVSNDLKTKKILSLSKFRFQDPTLVNVYSSPSDNNFVLEEAGFCYLYDWKKLTKLEIKGFKKVIHYEDGILVYQDSNKEIKTYSLLK